MRACTIIIYYACPEAIVSGRCNELQERFGLEWKKYV